MPIEVIDEIVPKNDGKFALMQAKHIEMPNGSRLSEFGIAYPTVNGTTVTLPLVDDKFFSLEPETFYVFGTVDSMPVFCNDPGTVGLTSSLLSSHPRSISQAWNLRRVSHRNGPAFCISVRVSRARSPS